LYFDLDQAITSGGGKAPKLSKYTHSFKAKAKPQLKISEKFIDIVRVFIDMFGTAEVPSIFVSPPELAELVNHVDIRIVPTIEQAVGVIRLLPANETTDDTILNGYPAYLYSTGTVHRFRSDGMTGLKSARFEQFSL
jgi:hypothetical protein